VFLMGEVTLQGQCVSCLASQPYPLSGDGVEFDPKEVLGSPTTLQQERMGLLATEGIASPLKRG